LVEYLSIRVQLGSSGPRFPRYAHLGPKRPTPHLPNGRYPTDQLLSGRQKEQIAAGTLSNLWPLEFLLCINWLFSNSSVRCSHGKLRPCPCIYCEQYFCKYPVREWSADCKSRTLLPFTTNNISASIQFKSACPPFPTNSISAIIKLNCAVLSLQTTLVPAYLLRTIFLQLSAKARYSW